MEIIYKTKDGTEFFDEKSAKKWESLERVEIENHYIEKVNIISPTQLKNIFEIGDVSCMCLVYKEEEGNIIYDSDYETFNIDKTGHLYCTDYSHGLFEWSEREQSYFRVLHCRSWKVEFLGIKEVCYW